MKRKQIIVINFKGGIVYTELLRTIISIENVKFYFGCRQNLYLVINSHQVDEIYELLKQRNINCFLYKEGYSNIVSSYLAIDIFDTNAWLTESIFDEILDSFDLYHKLKINIVNLEQNFVSPFDADLCFIPSKYPNFWYLLIKNPESKKFFLWFNLIYSTDLGLLAKEIENYIWLTGDYNINNIYNAINNKIKYIFIEKNVEPDFKIHSQYHYKNNNSWIELYNSKNLYDFLKLVVDECLLNKINKIYFTTKRTIVIKNLTEDDLYKWKIFIGKHNSIIKLQDLESNWKYKDFDRRAERLKSYLIKELYKNNINCQNITFSIVSDENYELISDIIIKIKYLSRYIPLLKYYEIYYLEKNTFPNFHYTSFYRCLLKSNLINVIEYLYKKYYDDLWRKLFTEENVIKKPAQIKQYWVPGKIYYCKDCLTVYDPEVGDSINNIPPGTKFEDLPDSYMCFVCSAPKSNFDIKLKTMKKFE
ncbi:rubredoxin [Rosettibacter firmus]|uniref:rubredoxin n=1 Tax=Rosettibacter firmus TaxID=3111522 RepID=UPI00336C0A96